MDRERVLGAAESLVWVPVDAQDETRPDHRLTLYPTFASVQWSRTDRPFEEMPADVLALDLPTQAGAGNLLERLAVSRGRRGAPGEQCHERALGGLPSAAADHSEADR